MQQGRAQQQQRHSGLENYQVHHGGGWPEHWPPPTSLLVTLTVTEARASILGSKEKVFRAGSSMQLVCTVKHLSQQPALVFW
jgi:hypothetical protein